ncbi:biopolymer transport protein ExbD [Pseudobythopirellula maris]|uniref:Biopolymer transport protein ExbD n=1 Tax=Pseudobythopirellula maris TaxID=2527991 RepID=A0A5C5ZSH7_9BACT|nr:biopolymer transporter ExbD [Pseudobythopirellula maris]TWT90018.1 biopolymer transport protein ExbD [Pseudobythopirellula maris]
MPAPLPENDSASPWMGMRAKRNTDGGDDIDITPMIDVTFLLLIFFLVGSVPDQVTAVELPEALHGKPVSQLKAVVFTLGDGGIDSAPLYEADGKLPDKLMPNEPEARSQAVAEVVTRGRSEKKNDVVIKADRGVAFRNVSALIKHISQVDGVQIHLAVSESE